MEHQRTRRAVVKVEIPAENIKNNIFIRLFAGSLKLTNPLSYHV